MKIGIDEERNFVLKEVYSGVLLETSEGNQLGVCMRDDTFELTIPKLDRYYTIDIKTGDIIDLNKLNSIVGCKMKFDEFRKCIKNIGTPIQFNINRISFGQFCIEFESYFDPVTLIDLFKKQAGILFNVPVRWNDDLDLNFIEFIFDNNDNKIHGSDSISKKESETAKNGIKTNK